MDNPEVEIAGQQDAHEETSASATGSVGLTGKRKRFGRLRVFLCIGGALIAISFMAKGPSKEQWLKQNAQRLSSMKITPDMIAEAEPWREEYGNYLYDVQLYGGIVPLGDGSGVYIVMHSWHDKKVLKSLLALPAILLSVSKPVSDAVLAMDQQGRFYTFETHVCGGLPLTSDKKVITLEDFLQTHRHGEREKVWRPYP